MNNLNAKFQFFINLKLFLLIKSIPFQIFIFFKLLINFIKKLEVI